MHKNTSLPPIARFFGSFSRAALALTALALASCTSGPTPVSQPYIDADDAGDAAMEEYDTDGDGVVHGDELEKAPGLKAALPRLDADGDGGVTADEVAARIDEWKAMETGLMSFGFSATLDGAPLEGATFTFEPVAFLGDEIKPAVTTTDMYGVGAPVIPKDQRPSPTTPPGVHIGLYLVKVSKIVDGQETIPARYNTATILGQEVAPDVGEIINRRVVYALTSK